ncbi:MAG: YebC/PmpR family DNA-binding transcriptional regulator [Parcubacteria group bacterium]|nr:YebC/PmpR family DNA-binding transcriptional regulator [Parcubacteria group bacterium]MCR4342791.1 YebC/PmpR family DNA-binding transcriptional regulator [Patescibacteria group bacterium]
MSGHNKWSKIKNKKAVTDAQKSKVFSKFSQLITIESKKAKGDENSPSLRAVVERAKKENMPITNIEKAIKKGAGADAGNLEEVLYEAYGPGGVALIIEGITDNKNRSAAEIKHILSKNGLSLAGQGSATWAFEKTHEGWEPKQITPIGEEDGAKLEKLIEELEDNDSVQNVYTNAE